MRAIEIKTGREISVQEDVSYHNRNDGTLPFKFPENMWVSGAQAGTWYFNKEGHAVAGLTPNGYDARFKLII